MPAIDLLFPVQGGPVPLDHAYLLFSALSRHIPALHERTDMGVFSLRGVNNTRELLYLGRGTLRLRCPIEAVATLLPLVSAPLEVAGRRLSLGAPSLHALEPVPALSARLVTFKHAMDESSFIVAVSRALEALGVQATLKVGRRRIVRIAGKKVVGFALELHGLSAEHSLRVQEQGLGGRRHMGCGLFLPPGRAARVQSRGKAA
ncbi:MULTISPECIES: type I-MYXAN CRISPR-associated protein Cas6/Cmx6 [Myxococcus]|uniref:CRISPR-associated protein Cas6, subtype MYXAN n=1 Tax=Myxococcus virescens TaxID=83456 RepID=A0A511HS96_9BACT|nr:MULTISPECIES: type I-MYXAN CRISPR-associated protein Cas6/Cmx6 [Myxococcus]WNZ62061.1 type I-MYXAN CRISPR-associated protein Cas6/Cmx6 [Myxococcus sp. MxC21-1]GEL75359.1 type I-MYXAN CRISPR-associated protein Cas6/Cmx6 [Myxococcus virescens]SDF35492.1 CRISPR-associated protein Cas6, subtype MYXAN [Myxococcus virescens]